MKKLLVLSATMAFAVSGAAFAQNWDETADGGGDAADVFNGAQSVANGGGPVTSITGGMDWFNLGDHVDAYVITIADAASFTATTNPSGGGDFTGVDGFEDDSRLALFDMAGNLIMANDDSPSFAGGSLESTLQNPSTWVGNGGVTLNSPGSVVDGGMYILAVTYYANTISDVDGDEIVTWSADFDALQGVNPAFDGASAWDDPGDFDDGWTYTVALTGVEGKIPAPGALALLGVAGLAGTRRRRRA